MVGIPFSFFFGETGGKTEGCVPDFDGWSLSFMSTAWKLEEPSALSSRFFFLAHCFFPPLSPFGKILMTRICPPLMFQPMSVALSSVTLQRVLLQSRSIPWYAASPTFLILVERDLCV